MGKFVRGRYTAQVEEPFVVFVIGLRIHNLFAIHRWLPIVFQMQAMLNELYRNKELGFLDMKSFLSWRGVTLLQYWKSFEHLEQYAKNGAIHLQAWRKFSQMLTKSNAVGFYHETYVVHPGQYECVYVNMPVYGLARATKHVPATGKRETARGRMTQAEDRDAFQTEGVTHT
jgi:hypothetical protein